MKLSPLVKKTITLSIIAGLGYGGYVYFFKKSSTSNSFTYINTTVKKGNIENSVEVIGTSQLVHEQKMRFNQTGKVAKIFYKESQKVKQGQIIAELDTTDVLNDIKQQELSLNNAQVKLAQITKGPEEKDVLSAENTITSTKSKITTLENDKVNIERDKINKQKDYLNQITAKQNDITSNENDIKNKQAQLVNAKNELATLEKTESKGLTDTDIDIIKTLDTAIVDARKQIIDADANLYNADEILGISDANRTKNDSYEVYLSAKDTTTKTRAENDWAKATSRLSEVKNLLNSIPQASHDSKTTKTLLDILSQLEDAMIILGKDGTDAVNASIISSSFPQSSIDSYANIFSSITSSSQSSLSAIKNTIATIDKLTDPELKKATSSNTISAKKQSIADLEYTINKLSIDTAQKYQNDLEKLQSDMAYSTSTYDAQLAAKDIDIINTKNTLKYNEESLRILKNGATKEEIILAKNSIAAQKLSLEKVKKNLTKYQLEAPFDGTIRKIDFQIGDNILSDEEKYVYIENPNLLEITATVDQLEVVKLKIGQYSKIIFDAYPLLTFTGTVSDINSTPTQTSGVTSYTIKIAMDKGSNSIFSGMSAKVDIIIEAKENVLIIGTSFIEKRNGKAIILKKNGATDNRIEVVTGISNPTNTEIVSGASEGDAIVRRISTGTGSSTRSSIIPTGGGTRNSSSSNTRNGGDGGGRPPGM